MLAPLLSVSIPVIIGTCLGLINKPKWSIPIRIFALVTSLIIIFFHLLPESYAACGLYAVSLFIVGILLPSAGHLAEKHISHKGDCSNGLEAGYIGLIVHQIIEGMAITGMILASTSIKATIGVIASVEAHTIPLAAAVVIAYNSHYSKNIAIRRSIGMIFAGIIGIIFFSIIPIHYIENIEPWIDAVVAGLLLHVVIHDAKVVDKR